MARWRIKGVRGNAKYLQDRRLSCTGAAVPSGSEFGRAPVILGLRAWSLCRVGILPRSAVLESGRNDVIDAGSENGRGRVMPVCGGMA